MSPAIGNTTLATLAVVYLCIVYAPKALTSRDWNPSDSRNTFRPRASAGTGSSEPLPGQPAWKDSAVAGPQALRRGRLYAVNVASGARAFQLLPIDVASVHPAHLDAGASGVSAHLRATYPDANVGWAWYADTYSEAGWYRLEIRIDEDAPFPDIVKARAAGFVEGNLQGQHMYRFWTNYRVNEYRGRGEAPSQELYNFFDEQYGWMTKRVEAATGWTLPMLRGAARIDDTRAAAADEGGVDMASGGSDSSDRRYWSLVGLVAAQFEGLAAGFWASVVDPARNMTWHELYALNAVGDMYELNVLFPPSAGPPPPGPALPSPTEPSAPEGLLGSSTASATTAEAAAAVGPGRVGQRHYTPGHGEVDEYGYGELLGCSAIIKISDSRDGDGDDDESDGDGGDGDDATGGGKREHNDSEAVRAASRGLRAFGATTTTSSAPGYVGQRAQGKGQTQQTQQGMLWQRQRQQSRSRDAGVAKLRKEDGEQEEERGGTAAEPPRLVRGFWAAHNTWRSYYDMVRTWKVYDMPWASTGALTVSSSPGLLHSKDDWYTTDKFVVMETTNGIYNKKLYDLIQSKCVLMWQRVQLANFGARSGSEWVDLFQRHNSGTYNNQWMVLDVPLLEAGRRTDVLWVLEQVPGTIVSEDATRVLLDQGYWASYNVPYFPEIYNLTGYPRPSIYSTCPRARIFRREQAHVASRADMMALMRLNRYTTDPASGGLPNAAIAARYDLPVAPDAAGHQNWTRRAYGAVDAKISDSDSFRVGRTYVINGPTADDQPPFRWSADPLFNAIPHEGCVDQFSFGWQAYQSVVGPPKPQPT